MPVGFMEGLSSGVQNGMQLGLKFASMEAQRNKEKRNAEAAKQVEFNKAKMNHLKDNKSFNADLSTKIQEYNNQIESTRANTKTNDEFKLAKVNRIKKQRDKYYADQASLAGQYSYNIDVPYSVEEESVIRDGFVISSSQEKAIQTGTGIVENGFFKTKTPDGKWDDENAVKVLGTKEQYAQPREEPAKETFGQKFFNTDDFTVVTAKNAADLKSYSTDPKWRRGTPDNVLIDETAAGGGIGGKSKTHVLKDKNTGKKITVVGQSALAEAVASNKYSYVDPKAKADTTIWNKKTGNAEVVTKEEALDKMKSGDYSNEEYTPQEHFLDVKESKFGQAYQSKFGNRGFNGDDASKMHYAVVKYGLADDSKAFKLINRLSDDGWFGQGVDISKLDKGEFGSFNPEQKVKIKRALEYANGERIEVTTFKDGKSQMNLLKKEEAEKYKKNYGNKYKIVIQGM